MFERSDRDLSGHEPSNDESSNDEPSNHERANVTMMPEPLRESVGAHVDGADLERVWTLLPLANTEPSSSFDADALWSRIAARTSDAAPVTSHTSSAPASAPASDAASSERAPAVTPILTLTRGVENPAPRTLRSRVRASWDVLAIAAVFALMIGWGSGTATVTTQPGEVRRVTLTDGSEATLNGASELRHPRWFRPRWLAGSSRAVAVRGEVFFDVTSDASRPFIVTTNDATVRVLGTRFTVSARSTGSNTFTDVAVEEGVVAVRTVGNTTGGSAVTSRDSIVLRAGDRVRATALHGLAPGARSIDASRISAWTRGGFAVVDRPFGEVLSELSVQYGVDIVLRDSTGVTDAISVYYPRRPPIDSVLLDLCTSRGLTLTRTSRGFSLSPAP